MYIDNICVNYAAADNNVNATQSQPIQSTGEESKFNDILTDIICELTSANQVNEAECPEINNVYPMDSVPPVIKTQESAASSYLSKYYPIPEDEVVQSISNVRHIINNTDLSEKSDIEKYDFIENKFIDTFGNDFLMARDLSFPSTMFYLIGVEFTNTLEKHIDNPEQVNRDRLYGDKSAGAVQDEIRAKYSDDLTNRELILMVNEMRSTGVLDTNSLRSIGAEGTQRAIDTLSLIRNYSRFANRCENNKISPMTMEERDRQWLSMLDKRVSTNDLLFMYNVLKNSGMVDMGKDTTAFLINQLGGKLDENGDFILPGSGYVNWDELLGMLMNEMNEYDDFIKDRMALIDGTPPTVVIEQPGTDDQPAVDDIPGTDEIPGAEENLEPGDSSGAEEYSGAGAEENTETADEAA